MVRLLVVGLSALFLMMACSQPAPKSGIDTAGMDKSVRPQDDFYQYMNGTWLKNTEIPADKARYGAFTALYDEAQKNLREIIEDAANKAEKAEGSSEQKVGDYYSSYMDTARIEQLGIKPLEEEMQKIAAAKNSEDVRDLMAHFSEIGVGTPLGVYINQDAKNSSEYILYFTQSGLGMPDRDYYLKKNEKFKDIRAKYLAHLEKMFTLAGMADAAKSAQTVMNIETQIAKAQWTRVENRDRDKTYNKFTIDELNKMTPKFSWDSYLASQGAKNIKAVILRQPSYFKAFGKLISSVSISDWKVYLDWKLLDNFASRLPQAFVDADFDFYSKTLRGIEKNRPRWKRAVSSTNGVLGEEVGKVYVSKYFKPEAKKRMVQLVDNLKAAFKERIDQLDWMSADTKVEAQKKLSKFTAKIGYPDKWKDYSQLTIDKNDLIGNVIRSSRFEHQYELAKLGGPIDRDEWHMTPQTVNAYYNPNMNEVVFPAAILQPPFFNFEADDAVNYGAIGAVIGHELTHGFDDQGRKSDGDGNLRDWWTDEDAEKFMERAQVMVDQYENFHPFDDSLHVNGKLTLGENIADIGGLTVAYHAYLKSLNGKEAPVIDGYTGQQRFFLGIAQVWRSKYRDEALRQRLLTDPHSPPQYRILGVVSNMPEFYAAFDVKAGDPMYRDEANRVKIW